MKKNIIFIILLLVFNPLYAENRLFSLKETPSVCLIEGQKVSVKGTIKTVKDSKNGKNVSIFFPPDGNRLCFYRKIGAFYQDSKHANFIRLFGGPKANFNNVKITGKVIAKPSKDDKNIFLLAIQVTKYEVIKWKL